MSSSAWHRKKTAVIGGSAGLGFSLAQALVRQGADVLLVARNENRLADVCNKLTKIASAQSSQSVIDYCVADTCTELGAKKVAEHLSPNSASSTPSLHLLINSVGQSDRGLLMSLKEEDLIDQFRVNLLSAFHATQHTLPMLKTGSGTIVNIGSLSSKFAPRMLGGYSISKFALAAFSQQLRLELAPDNVHVMLACPGPIRREDGGTRYAELAARRGVPIEATKPGGGAKLKGLDPDQLSEKILLAASRRQSELVIPWKARCLLILQSISPSMGDWLLRKVSS